MAHDDNLHPVDSATRVCCGGIGRHTPDCPAPATDADAATNHGCRFTWCENDMDTWESQRLEHFQRGTYVPATGDSLKCLNGYDRDLPSEHVSALGIAVRFNEDLDPAPKVVLHALGGVDQADTDYELRIDEAVMLYTELGKAIKTACEETNLSPRRIAKFYGPEWDQ